MEWAAVKSISFRSVNHLSFKELIQRANSNFSAPMYNTLRPDIMYHQSLEHQERTRCSVMVGDANSFDRCFLGDRSHFS
jgi:hypothetical protein